MAKGLPQIFKVGGTFLCHPVAIAQQGHAVGAVAGSARTPHRGRHGMAEQGAGIS